MKELSGWGRFPKIQTREVVPQFESELIKILQLNKSYIPRGNGRSYGDSAINRSLTINLTRMNRFIEWNNESGDLIAESGVLIADIVDTFLPRGWCLYVTPGTKFITLGGAIASDVHGKNHHKDGSLANHISRILIIDGTGNIKEIKPNSETILNNRE